MSITVEWINQFWDRIKLFLSGCQDDDDFNKMISFVKQQSLWIYCQQTLVKIEPQKREQIPWNQFRIIFPNWRENCVYSKMLNTHTSLHSWSEIEAIFGKEGVVVDAGVEPISNSVPNLLPANLTGHKHSSSQRLHDQRRGKACKLVSESLRAPVKMFWHILIFSLQRGADQNLSDLADHCCRR